MTTVSITKSLKKTNKVFQNDSLKTDRPLATRNEDLMLSKSTNRLLVEKEPKLLFSQSINLY